MLEQDPIYSLQGHLIYECSPAFWAAFNSTYYIGGRTTVDGQQRQEPENVRVGVTAALSLSRHQSIKFYGSTGVYNRTDNNFWAIGIAWQKPKGSLQRRISSFHRPARKLWTPTSASMNSINMNS